MARFNPAHAPALLKAARADMTLSSRALAELANIALPELDAIEAGRVTPSSELLAHLLEAADYRPSIALLRVREQVLAQMGAYGVSGISVFGSASRGEDHFGSDLDLILDASKSVTLRALAFVARIEELTGFPVDGHLRYSAEASEFGSRVVAGAVTL